MKKKRTDLVNGAALCFKLFGHIYKVENSVKIVSKPYLSASTIRKPLLYCCRFRRLMFKVAPRSTKMKKLQAVGNKSNLSSLIGLGMGQKTDQKDRKMKRSYFAGTANFYKSFKVVVTSVISSIFNTKTIVETLKSGTILSISRFFVCIMAIVLTNSASLKWERIGNFECK